MRMDEGEGVFTKDKAPQDAAPARARRDRGDRVLSRERQGPPARHDRPPARLVHQPPAQLGRAAALLPAQGQRRAAPGHDGADRPRRRHRRARRRRGLVAPDGRRRARRAASARRRTTPRATTSSTSGSTPARPSSTCCAAATRARRAPTTTGPEADLYLEGHDQHRGWFHSSLLIACAMEGHAPYRGLLTHGFTVDGSGRKMSKSLGNFIALHEVTHKLGAEIIRLWCAATDYSGDLAIDDKILARVVDAYRRIRNTLRFLLANTSDFDPRRTRCRSRPDAGDRPLGAGARRAAPGRGAGGHYEVYEFHPVVAKLQVFCSEDLGAFYLDILKDRLYTTAPNSHGAALGADRAVAHHARDAALDGAVPELHRRRGLEGVRARRAGVDLHRDLQRCERVARRRAAREVGAHPRDPRRRQQGDRSGAHRRRRSARRCRPSSRSAPTRPTTRCWRRWATT